MGTVVLTAQAQGADGELVNLVEADLDFGGVANVGETWNLNIDDDVAYEATYTVTSPVDLSVLVADLAGDLGSIATIDSGDDTIIKISQVSGFTVTLTIEGAKPEGDLVVTNAVPAGNMPAETIYTCGTLCRDSD